MEQILKQFKKIAIAIGVVLAIILSLFIFNQFFTLYDLLARIHPNVAFGVIVIIATIISFFLARMIILWIRSPKNLVLPENPTDEEYDEYLESMVGVLRRNKLLYEIDWDDKNVPTELKVTRAFNLLDQISMPVIKNNANSVFLTTAISQNGSLDSIFVLISMVRMTWQLANIYQTRPTLKSLGKLYIQIASVVFMARSIEDADLIENQLEPIIASVIGESITSAIPGMLPMSNLVVSSMMEGSLNALLALRVGIVAQSYLGMENPQPKSFIRRQSSLQAIGYMSSILKDNGSFIVKSVVNAVKKTGKRTFSKWMNPTQ